MPLTDALLNLSPDEIDHEGLRLAREAHDAAQATLKAKTRELQRLSDGRAEETAKEQDARAALDGRKVQHLASHRKAVETAEHEARVARLAADDAHRALVSAAESHGAEWIEELERQAQAADELWGAALRALTTAHEERTRANRRLRMVGGPAKQVGMVSFLPSQVTDSATGDNLAQSLAVLLPDAAARHSQRATVRADDVLAALQALGEPQEIAPFTPGGYVAELFKQAGDHARDVQRGYSDEDVRTGKLPGSIVDQSRHFINGAPRPAPEPVAAGNES